MFTLVACLVVVGVSAAAVLWQTRGGVYQPATEPLLAHRQSGLGHAASAVGGPQPNRPLRATSPSTSTPSTPSPAPAPAPDSSPGARRGIWRRLGAAARLFALVVLIGIVGAGVLGAVAAFAAFALREAVK